jgi:Fur family transcriptional regulator, iron response regulator
MKLWPCGHSFHICRAGHDIANKPFAKIFAMTHSAEASATTEGSVDPLALDPIAMAVLAPVASSKADLRTGCPLHQLRQKLRGAGLRPTRQRISLGWLLFAKGDRHLSAEMLFEEATRAKVSVSLATVYNTLHQFTEAGLLRELVMDGGKTFFDTNPTAHHHFFVEGEEAMIDVAAEAVDISALPEPPEGMEIVRVDVIVRLRRKTI